MDYRTDQAAGTPPVGRFAPSPSGPLHFGSLVAALGSYLAARNRGGLWLLRIEDLDPPRVVPGAADLQLRTLETLGLGWDGPVLYQSNRRQAYLAAADELSRQGLTYFCQCSRRDIADRARRGPGGFVYPGTCRTGGLRASPGHALRVRVEDRPISFEDGLQGHHKATLAEQCGDFVIRRADGVFAYQLAVVVDDHRQGVTQVTRGCDLLDSTPRQIHLQRLLGLDTPTYLHLPLVRDAEGHKLSKSTQAPDLARLPPGEQLFLALEFLGQGPPAELRRETPRTLLSWAMANWNESRVPREPRGAIPG